MKEEHSASTARQLSGLPVDGKVSAIVARSLLLEPPATVASVTAGVCHLFERPAPPWWWPTTLLTGL
ncbi:hypothetical protein, partial [Methylacidimicrobium cyclopophantes]|uniref:hypothetical protein n=1 Tax=Methylacidimicrobium cyclopophantes TaxID=1041766 RepID=UPI00115BF48E